MPPDVWLLKILFRIECSLFARGSAIITEWQVFVKPNIRSGKKAAGAFLKLNFIDRSLLFDI
ncbi:MAG: hypothetical protein DWB56_01340 [Candidatus Jettenia sp.]|nr:MAG: hypothetical protein EDM77_01260 [Candidatus Jettenia sp. AMX1]MBC6927598.1 hypothetical protein [Candidatus Jettenia sp.]MCE7881288.1 hypothetical protein [Candidatus Jettenia sp. AMX1]MCQ3926004.1 hypothetical protein [Candidatus Jettenia sp.]